MQRGDDRPCQRSHTGKGYRGERSHSPSLCAGRRFARILRADCPRSNIAPLHPWCTPLNTHEGRSERNRRTRNPQSRLRCGTALAATAPVGWTWRGWICCNRSATRQAARRRRVRPRDYARDPRRDGSTSRAARARLRDPRIARAAQKYLPALKRRSPRPFSAKEFTPDRCLPSAPEPSAMHTSQKARRQHRP